MIGGGTLARPSRAWTGTGGTSVGQRTGSFDEAVCVRAVRTRGATRDVTAMSYETSEARDLAKLRDGFGVTWRCLFNNGSVLELNAF